MSGWVKIHRRILEWEWVTKPLTFRLFIHLLLKANHADGVWRGEFIPTGSLITGRVKLAQECGMTEREVRTALTHLKTTNEVTIKTTKEYSIISITNWKSYQDNDQQNANERPTNDQPTTTNKNNKNNKKKEKDIGVLIPDWINSQNWNDYLEMRNRIKKPATERAKELILIKLEKFKQVGHDPNQILEQSILSNWQDVYEPKQKGTTNGKSKLKSEADTLLEQIRAGKFTQGTDGIN